MKKTKKEQIADTKCDILLNYTKQAFEEVIYDVTSEQVVALNEFEINPENNLFFTLIIGFSGEIDGRVLINTSYDDGSKLAATMNFGRELENEEDIHMYLIELANLFSKKIKAFNTNKFGEREIWISPPAIFSAKDMAIDTPNIPSIKAFYECPSGKFVIDMGFRESEHEEF